MKKIFFLANCSTSQAIIRQTALDQKGFAMQDIKFEKISADQLDKLKELAGSYEALFSRRAIKYREMGLKDKKLGEPLLMSYVFSYFTKRNAGSIYFPGAAFLLGAVLMLSSAIITYLLLRAERKSNPELAKILDAKQTAKTVEL